MGCDSTRVFLMISHVSLFKGAIELKVWSILVKHLLHLDILLYNLYVAQCHFPFEYKQIWTRPKIGLKWCASCGSFALSTISIVLSPADWYLNTFSFVIFLPDVSDNTINQHSPVEMQCNLLMSFHLMNPFPIRILFFPIINNHVSPKRSILRHPALLSVCVNDHRPTFISR